jgi:hypothetical protein
MKNILIFGASRAGKTTLAKRLKDVFQFNVVNEDHLINTFEQVFPQLEIGVEENHVQTAINATPFMAHYFCELANHANCKTGSKFVVDGTFFNFDTGIPLMKETLRRFWGLKLSDEFMFIFLDNTKTSEELFNDVRKYDTPEDWSYGMSDNDLRKHCDENVGVDWEFHEKWKELGFWRYDVVEGRELVFVKVVEDIKVAFEGENTHE